MRSCRLGEWASDQSTLGNVAGRTDDVMVLNPSDRLCQNVTRPSDLTFYWHWRSSAQCIEFSFDEWAAPPSHHTHKTGGACVPACGGHRSPAHLLPPHGLPAPARFHLVFIKRARHGQQMQLTRRTPASRRLHCTFEQASELAAAGGRTIRHRGGQPPAGSGAEALQCFWQWQSEPAAAGRRALSGAERMS